MMLMFLKQLIIVPFSINAKYLVYEINIFYPPNFVNIMICYYVVCKLRSTECNYGKNSCAHREETKITKPASEILLIGLGFFQPRKNTTAKNVGPQVY